MYRLATMHSVTDGRTAQQTDDSIMPIALADQYDRLAKKHYAEMYA